MNRIHLVLLLLCLSSFVNFTTATGTCIGAPATRGSFEDATTGTCSTIAATDSNADKNQCTTGCIHAYLASPLDPVWGSVIMVEADDNFVDFNLGFNFNFQGTTYTSIHVTTNGWVTLGSTNTGDYYVPSDSSFLSGMGYGVPTLCLMWLDLYTQVYGKTDNSGTAVITWDGRNLGGGAHVSFQLVLHADGSFAYRYKVPTDYIASKVITGYSSGHSNSASSTDILNSASPLAVSAPDFFFSQYSVSTPYTLVITKQLTFIPSTSPAFNVYIDPAYYSSTYQCDGSTGTWTQLQACALVTDSCVTPLTTSATVDASGGTGTDPSCSSLSTTNGLLSGETCHVACVAPNVLTSGSLTYTCDSGALGSGPTCSPPPSCSGPPTGLPASIVSSVGTCQSVSTGSSSIAFGAACSVGCAAGFQGSDLDPVFGSAAPLVSYGTYTAYDEGIAKVTLGFSFPFAGTSYTDVYINSNGMVELGGSAHFPFFSGNPSALISSAHPIIAPLWADLVGPAYFKTSSTEAVITWDTTFFKQSATLFMGAPIQIQLHMYPDGSFKFLYFVEKSSLRESNIVVGYSQGNNVADPGTVPLDHVFSYKTSSNTLYQNFPTTTELFTLASRIISFTKNPIAGYFIGLTPAGSNGQLACAATFSSSTTYSGTACVTRTALPCTSPPENFKIDLSVPGDTCGQVSAANPVQPGQTCTFTCKPGYKKSQNRDLVCVDGTFELTLQCDGYVLASNIFAYGKQV